LKTSIIITVAFVVLMVYGCGGTTYLNLSENNVEKVIQTIENYPTNENAGAELILTLKDNTEITGELLSIRENSITICEYYSAPDEELIKIKYPIFSVSNDEIEELTIKGKNNIWSGLGIGALAGTAFGFGYAGFIKASEAEDEEDPTSISTYFLVTVPAGFTLGTLFGAGVGAATSVEEIILNNIPPGYDFSIMNPISRYPHEEPKYLKAIK